jgi:hypothetical protein
MKEGSSGGASLRGFPLRGTRVRASLLGNQKDEFFLEICKMPRRRASLFVGALLGNLGGVCLPGLLREEKYIWVPFWTQRPLRF